jgi:methylmalonyl-CoA mutase, N-terminal domain
VWEQVAKFRAGRRLWARLMKERDGATDPKAMQLRMIAGGGGGGLTIQQPENNITRGAYYALASALSGTQTMALCSYDEAYTIPSEHAAHLSLRSMQILMLEAGLCDTVDPLAGSWFIESVTNQMEALIEETMRRVETEGGIVRAIAEGRIQAAVNRQAYEHEQRIRSGEVAKVGVNCFVEREDEPEVEMHPYRPDEAQSQVLRLAKLKTERDARAVARVLDEVSGAAREGRNVMPSVMNAVRAYATVGEVCGVLRQIFGTYQEPVRF